jgi:outer membrane protein assembly factor BamD (BamD/ComL family)
VLEALDDLKHQIQEYQDEGEMTRRLEWSLLAKVQAARFYVRHDRPHAAAHRLEAMVNQIWAQRGKEISKPAAADLIHQANALIRRLMSDDEDDDRDDDKRRH